MKSFLATAVRRHPRAGRRRATSSAGSRAASTARVVATLCHRAVGKRLTCVLVDHGLLREGRGRGSRARAGRERRLQLVVVDARERFLDALAASPIPSSKRKIIGARVHRACSRRRRSKHGPVEFLAQGTLYPDVIESASAGFGAQVIKTHHNVGGLPERMHLKLVEPLRLAVQGRGARAGPRAGPARLTWSTAIRSRAPGSRCAPWAR